MPPLLLNHFWQDPHCTAPSCSHTGFLLSSRHLCLFLSSSLLNDLPNVSQLTSRTSAGISTELSSLLSSMPILYSALYPALDFLASAYHTSSSTPMFLSSFLIWSLHLFLEPHLGRLCGSQLKRTAFGIL